MARNIVQRGDLITLRDRPRIELERYYGKLPSKWHVLLIEMVEGKKRVYVDAPPIVFRASQCRILEKAKDESSPA